MNGRIGSWIGHVASIAAILGLVFYVMELRNIVAVLEGKNFVLEREIQELRSEVQECQSEVKELKDGYRHLLVRLITGARVSIAEIEPFLPEEEVREVEEQVLAFVLPLPANVDVYFFPSGWMGDGEDGERYIQFSRSDEHIRITYTPGPRGWAGIYWQYPDSNWGAQPGRNLTGAQRLTFWARGETGTEIVEFKTGGIRGQRYEDSFEISLGRIRLSQSWEQYEIDLTDQDLSSVIGAFAWIASEDLNPGGLTFYLKDIYFEE